VLPTAQKTPQNTNKTPVSEKSADRRTGSANQRTVRYCALISRLFSKLVFFQCFAAFFVRLHALGKQQQFRAPQESADTATTLKIAAENAAALSLRCIMWATRHCLFCLSSTIFFFVRFILSFCDKILLSAEATLPF